MNISSSWLVLEEPWGYSPIGVVEKFEAKENLKRTVIKGGIAQFGNFSIIG